MVDDETTPEPDHDPPVAPVMGQPNVGELAEGGAQPVHQQPPIPGGTSPEFWMTPMAPIAPFAPRPGGQVAPVAPPGWHTDPMGRHQYRWFDGMRWTNHVGDDGVASTDEGVPS